jgi:hypothetical protein
MVISRSLTAAPRPPSSSIARSLAADVFHFCVNFSHDLSLIFGTFPHFSHVKCENGFLLAYTGMGRGATSRHFSHLTRMPRCASGVRQHLRASERKCASCFLPASPKYSSGRRLFSAVHYFCICLSLFESSVMQQRLFVPAHLANGRGSVQICFSSSALFMLVSFCRARIIKVIFAVARNNKAAAQSRIITQR